MKTFIVIIIILGIVCVFRNSQVKRKEQEVQNQINSNEQNNRGETVPITKDSVVGNILNCVECESNATLAEIMRPIVRVCFEYLLDAVIDRSDKTLEQLAKEAGAEDKLPGVIKALNEYFERRYRSRPVQ